MKTSKKILIVEDNPDISKALGEVLSDMGYQVDYAFNGKDGIDHLINKELPCLIILDLFMPVLSGIEFRTRQLQIPLLASIPVIVMSADAYVNKRCIPMHITHYLKKPFELADLIEKIKECESSTKIISEHFTLAKSK